MQSMAKQRLFENIVFYYEKMLLGALVPFLKSIYDLMYNVINLYTLLQYTLYIGPRSLSRLMSVDMDNIVSRYVYGSNETEFLPVVVGHMSGGMSAKYASLKYGFYSVAFESPRLSTSAVSAMAVKLIWHVTNYAKLMTQNRDKIHNFFSGNSLFSFMEDETMENVRLPDIQSFLKPANVYETFCLIAAGCTMSNQYDRFCSKTVGESTFLSYFDKWNRTRTNITLQY